MNICVSLIQVYNVLISLSFQERSYRLDQVRGGREQRAHCQEMDASLNPPLTTSSWHCCALLSWCSSLCGMKDWYYRLVICGVVQDNLICSQNVVLYVLIVTCNLCFVRFEYLSHLVFSVIIIYHYKLHIISIPLHCSTLMFSRDFATKMLGLRLISNEIGRHG